MHIEVAGLSGVAGKVTMEETGNGGGRLAHGGCRMYY